MSIDTRTQLKKGVIYTREIGEESRTGRIHMTYKIHVMS